MSHVSEPLMPDATDRLLIAELHARYAHAIDSGDADGWAACFTPDGVLRTSTGRTISGHAELRAFASSWWESRTGATRHVTWHRTFEPDGPSVRGLCSAALLVTRDTGVVVEFTAEYADRFVLTNGRWLLAERSVTLDRATQQP